MDIRYRIAVNRTTIILLNKSFNVKYDKANNAIIIDSMSPYKGKSAPMKKGNGKKYKTTMPATSIVWDGEVTGIPCYKINGNYYVTAYDIAELTDSRFEDIIMAGIS